MRGNDRAAGRMNAARNRADKRIKAAKIAVEQVLGKRGEAAIIDVTMLGAVGVGKTTLMASMYERFDRVIGTTDLAVRPQCHGL